RVSWRMLPSIIAGPAGCLSLDIKGRSSNRERKCGLSMTGWDDRVSSFRSSKRAFGGMYFLKQQFP
ncbi:MAG: hypothetical protein WCD82_25365, partial [Xanthobacteraceae bacterium]